MKETGERRPSNKGTKKIRHKMRIMRNVKKEEIAHPLKELAASCRNSRIDYIQDVIT